MEYDICGLHIVGLIQWFLLFSFNGRMCGRETVLNNIFSFKYVCPVSVQFILVF